MTMPGSTISRQGNYAGAVSRLAAFGADIGIAWATVLLIFASVNFAVNLATSHNFDVEQVRFVAAVAIPIWYFIYFSYQWALGGKTLGMALFGIRVVTKNGERIRPRQAVLRTLVLPISIAVLGLGLIGIVLRVDHRGWHDRVASTCVVYAWDARAARLMWLARQHEQNRTTKPTLH